MSFLSDKRNDEFFRHFIKGVDEKLQAQLSLEYARKCIMDRGERQQEREQMKREIIEEVLARLSIMVENGEALQKIEALDKAIKRLGQ